MLNLKSFQDFRSEISIIELAISNGYKLSKSDGLKWPVLKDEISGEKIIIVNPRSSSNQGYFNPNDPKDKGTLINFIKNRLGSIFPYESSKSEMSNINSVLYSYQNLDIPEKRAYRFKVENLIEKYSTSEFRLPEGITELKNPVCLYSRGLQSQTLNDVEFKRKIFNVKIGEYDNIGFPYYDANDEVAGYEIRNKQYKQMVEGSKRSSCIWHSNIPYILDRAVLTESPIDALSYHQLKGKRNTLYVSFGGSVGDQQIITLKAIINRAKTSPYFQFISAVDNDNSGRTYTKKFKAAFGEKLIVDLPSSKDFNDDLKKSQTIFKGFKM
ncbi:MAG: DUF3991 and toprim domain-containing protein [Bacteroidota bacterium]|nr:DUF3991 and toprim domain-containing protein [Bacteroidota bacterium]